MVEADISYQELSCGMETLIEVQFVGMKEMDTRVRGLPLLSHWPQCHGCGRQTKKKQDKTIP